jgi:hypothetical protein
MNAAAKHRRRSDADQNRCGESSRINPAKADKDSNIFIRAHQI